MLPHTLSVSKHRDKNNTNSNHAAYRKETGCELAMSSLTVCINKLTCTNENVYIALSELNKAFDKFNRSGILIAVFDISINGNTTIS